MFIYVIVCSETLKIYVGQHKGNNLQKYLQTKFSDAKCQLNRRSHLFNAMRLHSKDSWSIHPLVSGIEDKRDLDETEQLLISALNAQHPDVGYNICDGGEGFTGPHSDESRQKMREKVQAFYDAGGQAGMKGKKQTAKWFAGLPAATEKLIIGRRAHVAAGDLGGMLGKKHSDASRKKMSESRQGTGVGDQNPFFGRHHSEVAKEKNAAAHRGRKVSEATRKRMSDAHKARQARIRLSLS